MSPSGIMPTSSGCRRTNTAASGTITTIPMTARTIHAPRQPISLINTCVNGMNSNAPTGIPRPYKCHRLTTVSHKPLKHRYRRDQCAGTAHSDQAHNHEQHDQMPCRRYVCQPYQRTACSESRDRQHHSLDPYRSSKPSYQRTSSRTRSLPRRLGPTESRASNSQLITHRLDEEPEIQRTHPHAHRACRSHHGYNHPSIEEWFAPIACSLHQLHHAKLPQRITLLSRSLPQRRGNLLS